VALTLKQQIAADVADVFLNEDEFAESLVFQPQGGQDRPIVGSVDQATEHPDTGMGGIDRVERIEVFVSRDEDDEMTGGVATVQIGDRLKRTVNGIEQVYGFTGEILDEDDNSWTLVFERAVPFEVGGNRQR
jgi:hypothetical protein